MKRREFLRSVAGGVAASQALPALARRAGSAAPVLESIGPRPIPRWRENLNAGWLFCRQEHGGGDLGSFDRDTSAGAAIEPAFLRAHEAGYDDSWWRRSTCRTPGTLTMVAMKFLAISAASDGIASISSSPRTCAKKRVFLEFEGANQVSEFWLNGRRVGEHKADTRALNSMSPNLSRSALRPMRLRLRSTISTIPTFHPP